MKIIAKTKDYYDYLQGIYGVDDKLVYDRRNGSPYHGGGELDILRVLVNNVAFPIICFEGRFRGTVEDFAKGSDLIDAAVRNKKRYLWFGNPLKGYLKSSCPENWFARESRKVDINTKNREPVLIQRLGPNGVWKEDVVKPLHLEDYDFASVMSAHDVYIEISNFLSWCVDNPPIPDRQSNKEKIVSHGFDLKKSFRHR